MFLQALPMQIAQAVFGVFHHFELARELHRREHLHGIYSTWPQSRLQREGLPQDKVHTFPYLHVAEYAVHRFLPSWHWLSDELGYANALAFDQWLDRQLPTSGIDALIAIAGAGLTTGRHLQQRGGIFICDRGSTHARYAANLLTDEYQRWGLSYQVDHRDTIREEEIYLACDAISVPSSFSARSFIESGISADKVHVLPYGVLLERFSSVHEPPTDRFEALFVGQVSLRKGIPYLLQAFARLKHPNKRLRIAGAIAPEMKPILEKLPQENVEFLGILPQAQLPALMSSSHLLVLPSIEEGLALVQGQAMACGCPVLASFNTGAEDLFSDGVEGFIVPVRDVDALVQRMQ